MVLLATIASFLAAALLFAVQPMAARMALPLLGGSASVWTTCVLFFQAGLLLGYVWSHLIGSRLNLRTQVILHGALLAAALVALPPAITGSSLPPVDSSPVPWLLTALATSFGLPYAALAASGPLLQRWFSATSHPKAADPYFLYAASNAGSFSGLLAYPLIVERVLPLRPGADHASQSGVWSAGLLTLAVLLIGFGAWCCLRATAVPRSRDETRSSGAPWSSRFMWLALAFVPSSVVLGATQYLTSNIAAIPLFWIVPLALYLLTFIFAFSTRARISAAGFGVALGVLLLAASGEFSAGAHVFGRLSFGIHLSVLVAVGLVCHCRLAATRPDRSRLTEYYFWIALGGCLGGAFNAIVSPLLFDSIAEYPLALALAAFLVPDRPRAAGTPRERIAPWIIDATVVLVVGGTAVLSRHLVPTTATVRLMVAILVGVPGLIVLVMLRRPRYFAFAISTLLVVVWTSVRNPWSALYRERTFYGVHQIFETAGPSVPIVESDGRTVVHSPTFHVFIDGSTLHGAQTLDPKRRLIPATYYHPSGPLGDIMRGLRKRGPIAELGIIGLGAGTIAAYGEPGERITFFELDPSVARIARDPALFSYVKDSRAEVSIVLGDGRRRIAECADGRFDLIVLDAFSSDAIPVHLLTREAVMLYLRKLKPGGALAIHLTNGYLSLEPIVGAIAADLGVPAALKEDPSRTLEEKLDGKEYSKWAVIARGDVTALPVRRADSWSLLPPRRSAYPDAFHWTDDRSNLVALLMN